MESSFFKRVCCFIVNPILSGACPETSKRKKTSGQSNLCPDDGVDNGTRTPDLLLRRQLLYPAELLARIEWSG